MCRVTLRARFSGQGGFGSSPPPHFFLLGPGGVAVRASPPDVSLQPRGWGWCQPEGPVALHGYGSGHVASCRGKVVAAVPLTGGSSRKPGGDRSICLSPVPPTNGRYRAVPPLFPVPRIPTPPPARPTVAHGEQLGVPGAAEGTELPRRLPLGAAAWADLQWPRHPHLQGSPLPPSFPITPTTRGSFCVGVVRSIVGFVPQQW